MGGWADLLAALAPALHARGRGRDCRARSAGERRSQACSSTRRSTRSRRRPRRSLTMVQLHGDEGPSYCDEVRRRTGCRVIKAARIRSGADIQALGQFHTDFHLLDSYRPGVPGGTGETFSWELARAHRGWRIRVPMILSGGLTPDNVAEAIEAVHPFAVDVASGVELIGSRPPARIPTSSRDSPRRSGRPPAASLDERRRAPFRPLRRPVRAGDADAGAGGARGGLGRGPRRTRSSAPSSTGCCGTTSGGPRRCTSPHG